MALETLEGRWKDEFFCLGVRANVQILVLVITGGISSKGWSFFLFSRGAAFFSLVSYK